VKRQRERARKPHERLCEQCGNFFASEEATTRRRFCGGCKIIRDRENDRLHQAKRRVRIAKEKLNPEPKRKLPDWHGDWDKI
jgi:hypothetical protein